MEESEIVMQQGIVKWFNTERGFGFITADDGQEYSVHCSNIEGTGFRSLEENQSVSFDIEDTKRGPKAVNVLILEELF